MIGYIHHVTLDTGHVRLSPRSEVDDVAVAALHDGLNAILAGDRAAIPGMNGYSMTGAGAGRCISVTAWSPPRGDSRVPLVTMGIAVHSRCGARLWLRLHQAPRGVMPPLATAGRECPPEPWCAARLEIGIVEDMPAARWLGDWERCMAWAWLGRQDA